LCVICEKMRSLKNLQQNLKAHRRIMNFHSFEIAIDIEKQRICQN
jgi:hypothetical protein